MKLVSEMTESDLEALLTRVVRAALHPSITSAVSLDIQAETGLGCTFADGFKPKHGGSDAGR